MSNDTFEAFKTRKLNEGYNEALVREWEPGLILDPHAHPFDADALVVKGEFWLTMNGRTTHYKAGDAFKVGRGMTHSEQYGPEGAVFWAARKN